MKGLFLLSMTEYELAIDVLSPYQDEEENVEVIKPALVKCYIGLHQYDKALELCEQLISLKSTTKRLLQKVYCLFQLYRTDEAMAILYEMDYKNPNDLQILRPLAWGNILRFEYEKAKDIYERLASDDFLPFLKILIIWLYVYGCRVMLELVFHSSIGIWNLPILMSQP